MTLALTGPWAWAELSDPPPGEPTPPPPGEPTPPPSGPPPPPPPPDPPPPPLPPDPGGPGPGYIPPVFSWHGYGPLVSLWDVDLKVTPGLSTTGENTPCRVFATGTTLDRWPYANVYNSSSGTYTHVDAADWSLNDPARTYDLMQLNNVSLYLHDANAGTLANYIENTDYRCDWISLAGLNDHIEAVEGPWVETFTGIVLGRKEPEFAALPGYTVDDFDMCFYRSWVARARAEAFVHPHHKVVLVDELTHMLASPFEFLKGSSSPWSTGDVESLRELVTEVDATAAGSQRAACDAIWAPVESAFDPTGAGGWHPAPSTEEAPLELWAKVNAVTVPMFLVPSFILTVPGGFLSPPATSGAPVAAPFLEGERLSARWSVVPQHAGSPAVGKVWLRYFATTLRGDVDDLSLRARVNGVALPASSLFTKPIPGAATDELRRRSEIENIYAIDVLLYDAAASSPPLGWHQTGAAPNTVDLVVRADANSLTFRRDDNDDVAEWSDTADRHADRGFVVWGVEVVYEGQAGEVLEFQRLDPKDADGVFTDAAGVEGPCLGGRVCSDNQFLRIENLLDGLTIAQDINTTWPAPLAFAHVPMAEAWERFIAHTCTHLHSNGPGGAPVRCMVDERAWVSDTAQYLPDLDIDESLARLGAGYDKGDGASVLWLPLEFEDIVGSEGRFAPRPALDPGWPYLAYQPRLTRNQLGEGIVWEVDTGGDPACDGTWQVQWRAPDCPTQWTYGPLVDRWSLADEQWVSAVTPIDKYTFAQLIEIEEGAECADLNVDDLDDPVDLYVPGPHWGKFTFDLLADANGLFRFGWQIKSDLGADVLPDVLSDVRTDAGNSLGTPRQIEFRLTPPPTCPNYYVGQEVLRSPDLYDFYTELTCVMQGTCL